MNNPIILSDETIKLIVDPRIGGSFLNFSTRVDKRWVDIMRTTPADFKTSSDTSSFLMAPYPNRIRDGKFSFEGRDYALQFPEKHAIHGDVRNRPWQVESTHSNTATIHFNSKDFSDINYPFPFSVTQSFGVSNSALLVKCSIKNEGTTSMPAGCGYHPYFNRALGGSTENVHLRFKTEGAYPFTGDVPLPTGMPRPLLPAEDFSTLRDLNVNLDTCFTGWEGDVEMVWPESNIMVSMHAGSNMSHLVLFSPPGKSFFALEPQSQMIDGFNFLARGETHTGVSIVPPGGELAVWFSLSVKKRE
jgi:aldose 1-epimerase